MDDDKTQAGADPPAKTDPAPEPKEIVKEFTEDEFKSMLKGYADETMKPLVDEIKDLREQVTRAQPNLVGQLGHPTGDPQPTTRRAMIEKRMAERTKRSDVPEDEFSFVRAMNALVNHDWSLAPAEKEMSDYIREKTLNWASGSAGGLWVPEEFLGSEFVELFRSNVVCRAAGCTVIEADTAPVIIPTMQSSTTGYWKAQGEELPATDVTPGTQITMIPHAAIARSSTSQLQAWLSKGVTEQIIRKDIAAIVTRLVDKAILNGTGTNNQPTGMVNVAGINTTEMGTNGGYLTDSAKLFDMLYELELDNVPVDNLVWICHPRTLNQIRTLKVASETNHYAFQPAVGLTGKARGTLLGYPVYTTTQIPINLDKGSSTGVCSELFLINMSDVYLCEWGAFNIQMTEVGGTAWAYHNLEFKLVYWCDCAVRHPVSVCLMSDIL